jgi:hypothetical protein
MFKLSKESFIRCVATTLLVASHCAFAGTAEVVNSDGSSMKFEYEGDNFRFDTGQGEDSYMVMRDDHMYVVTNSDGQLMVIDIEQAMGMFGGMAGAIAPSVVASEVVRLEATGRTEQHAGVTGEVYELSYMAEDGKQHEMELVLSDDPRAKAFSMAMNNMAKLLSRSAGKNFENAANDMQKRLTDLDMGVLRYGDDMHVTALSDETVEDARFELPAEPTKIPSFGDLLSQPSQSGSGASSSSEQNKGSGGVVSSFLGAFGGGAAKDNSAGEDTVQDEQGEEGDEAEEQTKENPLGKAFGKLFGK